MKNDRENAEERLFLNSWKEIAEYLGKGVRTVQRYERDLGLPVRRPAGQFRSSVMAKCAEVDAWVDASPIRHEFRVSLIQMRTTPELTGSVREAVSEMHKLRTQMTSLRAEVRLALHTLMASLHTFKEESALYNPMTSRQDETLSNIHEN